MTGPLAGSLAEQLAEQRRKLATALRAGQDTAGIRETIAGLDRHIASEAAEVASVKARAAQDRDAAERREATSVAAERLNTLAATIQPRRPAQDTLQPSWQGSLDHHRAAVTGMLAAVRALAAARAVAAAAAAEHKSLCERLSDLDTRRAEMAARRQAGRPQADDAANLALLDLDRGGLADLETAARNRSATAAEAVTAASTATDASSWRLAEIEARLAIEALLARQAEADAIAMDAGSAIGEHLAKVDAAAAGELLKAMVAQAKTLEDRLAALLDHLGAAQKRTGRIGKPAWGPSQATRERLFALSLRRNEI